MITRKRILLALMMVFAMLVAGCAGTTEETKQAPTDEGATAAQVEETTQDQPETVTEEEVKEATTEAKENKAGEITEDQALDIALKHAGVAKKDTSLLQINREVDDGIDKYEIEFHVDKTEYSYDIDAKTGDILEYDSEIDDND